MTSAAIEIPALLARYADAFDAGDFQAAARLFDGGCVVVDGKEISGAERIAAMWASFVHLYEDGTPRTRHLVTNPAISVASDGCTASCRSQWTVLQQLSGQALKLVGTGRYEDEFNFHENSWRFSRRTYGKVDFWGDASDHLKAPSNMKETNHGNL